MPELDPKVAAVVDSAAQENDSDEDDLIAQLEDDSELDAFREQRLQQLHAEFNKARQLRANDHGTYVEIKDEKALMDITTSTKLCVVHFFKPDFNRCRIMDTHLEVCETALNSGHLYSKRYVGISRFGFLSDSATSRSHRLTTRLVF